MKSKGPIVHGGHLYGRLTADGPLVPVTQWIGQPDAWICRRLSDFPDQRLPAGGATATCRECAAVIVFNPARTVAAPKVCMQCADVHPLPILENS